MTTHKVEVDTATLSREELEKLLGDKDKEIKKLREDVEYYIAYINCIHSIICIWDYELIKVDSKKMKELMDKKYGK